MGLHVADVQSNNTAGGAALSLVAYSLDAIACVACTKGAEA